MEQPTDEMLKVFWKDIQNTLLTEILNVPEEEFAEPKMKIGPEPDNKIVGQMTHFEKQCFTLFYAAWARYQSIAYDSKLKKIDNIRRQLQAAHKLLMSQASDKEVIKNQLLDKTSSYLDESIFDLRKKDAWSRVVAINSLLCQTIKDRLGLNRGDNVRYYVSAGYQIVSETGIKDRLEAKLKEQEELIKEEMVEMFNLDQIESDDDESSKFIEEICVLF